jgi:hypothetical protein
LLQNFTFQQQWELIAASGLTSKAITPAGNAYTLTYWLIQYQDFGLCKWVGAGVLPIQSGNY